MKNGLERCPLSVIKDQQHVHMIRHDREIRDSCRWPYLMHRKQCCLHQFTKCRELGIFLPLHNPRQQLAVLTHRECSKEELFTVVAEVKLHGADYTIKDGAPPRTPDSPLPRAEFGRKNRAPPRTSDSACLATLGCSVVRNLI